MGISKASANAVTPATKGALAVGSGTNTASILSVGSNGDTLVADSSQTTGLRYNPQNALANPVINGGFDIWQRGTAATSIATSGTFFLADRWQCVRTSFASGGTVSRQSTNDTTNLPTIQYCARIQRDSGNTSTNRLIIGQNFETVNTFPFIGKTITLSFYARAGANYSATSSNLNAVIYTGTGTDQNVITSSYTGSSSAINNNATLTTTWQRFVLVGTIPTTATEMSVNFEYTPTGTAGAADYFEITGVQIDLGTYTASTAPSFRRSGGTLAGELAACQRYYEKSYNVGTAIQTNTGVGRWNGTAQWSSTTGITENKIQFKVPKRGTPTITLYRSDGSATNPNFWEYSLGTNETYAAFIVIAEAENSFGVYSTSGSGGTTNNATAIRGHWVASAEL